jgi:hypothetical protein
VYVGLLPDNQMDFTRKTPALADAKRGFGKRISS